ncbi:AMP nucleosidase, partial [Salmonella enterica]
VEGSHHEIPYPFFFDCSALTLVRSMSAGLTRHFTTTELAQLGDETADGRGHPGDGEPGSPCDARRGGGAGARGRRGAGARGGAG